MLDCALTSSTVLESGGVSGMNGSSGQYRMSVFSRSALFLGRDLISRKWRADSIRAYGSMVRGRRSTWYSSGAEFPSMSFRLPSLSSTLEMDSVEMVILASTVVPQLLPWKRPN